MPNQKELSFAYDYYTIRAVVDSNNELLFCLADICRALNWYSTTATIPAEKIKAHFKLSEVPTYKFHHAGGNECYIIKKAWLYFIIASVKGSKVCKANHFIKWFEAEVLPNLEQDSQLQALPQVLPQQPKSYGELLMEAGRLALENERLLAQIKEKENHSKIEAEVILKREFLGSEISQKSENGYFSATDLFKVANQWRASQGLCLKSIEQYNCVKSAKEFEAQLAKQYITRIYKRGWGQHLWIHPFLFVDMALWLFNPDFKLEVYEWIFNDLPKYIDGSCKGE